MTEVVPIVVMTKFPQPGKVKTRLTPALTPEEAAGVHNAMMSHWINRLSSNEAKISSHTVICYDPPESLDAFREKFPGIERSRFVEQSPGDLGERIAAAASCVRTGSSRCLFVGIDAPDVPLAYVAAAAKSLLKYDIVLGPTDDGGYWLIGFAPSVDVSRLLSGISWSSGKEREQTVERAKDLGYTVGPLPFWFDVDTPDDLGKLFDRLSISNDGEDKELLRRLAFVPVENLP